MRAFSRRGIRIAASPRGGAAFRGGCAAERPAAGGAGRRRHAPRMRAAVRELNAQYDAWGVAFHIAEIANGFQMMTRPEYRPLLSKLNRQRMETRLSDATLETLAIVAYKQPIIRADIESIRGVACGEVLNRLREMGLLRIV